MLLPFYYPTSSTLVLATIGENVGLGVKTDPLLTSLVALSKFLYLNLLSVNLEVPEKSISWFTVTFK